MACVSSADSISPTNANRRVTVPMFSTLQNYVAYRKSGLTRAVGVVGGLYIAKHYISNRLEEVKDRLERERGAKDILKRRFQQAQDDVSYTVLALLPTLADQILENMDVEALTRELQGRSKARHTRQHPKLQSSLTSSIDIVQEQDVRSDTGSVAHSVASTNLSLAEPLTSHAASGEPKTSGQSDVRVPGSAQDPLSSSIVTTSAYELGLPGDGTSTDGSRLSDNLLSSSMLSEAADTRTKAELWNEVKMLTLTRTLTTLYSTTLLCLLTTIQLTLLARSKYICAVLLEERDERMQERLQSEFSISKLLLGGGQGLEDLMSGDFSTILAGEDADMHAIPEDAESKYLTLSWWLLHVGWKDVGERVRRGVEEVFDGVSLKTKLSVMDLHRLIGDIRRRVEHEITFEGHERRINFLSTLLPLTPEMVQHVLTQGGFPAHSEETSSHNSRQDQLAMDSSTSLSSSQLSHSNYFLSALNNTDPFATLIPHPNSKSNSSAAGPSRNPDLQTLPIPNPHPHTADPHFTNLLKETHAIICSSDFAVVLENCLDRATEVLFDGLEKNIFAGGEAGSNEEVRIRLAGMLPGLSRWSSLALRGVPCELVDNILAVREVPCLSAIEFAKFEESFR